MDTTELRDSIAIVVAKAEAERRADPDVAACILRAATTNETIWCQVDGWFYHPDGTRSANDPDVED